MDFDFYAAGIEDGIIEALTPVMKAPPLQVRELTTYSGELDDFDNLKKAIASEARKFPIVMVSYGGGKDTRSAPTPPVMGHPLHYRHDCYFGVVVADDNPLGEKQRRRNKAYSMLAAARKTLTGLRLSTMVDGEKVTLTHGVLEPDGNDYVMNLPNVTAYVVVFKTWFNWSSPDRSTAGTDVSELVLGVSADESRLLPATVPGVNFESE